jgi:hypothetical protein
LIFATDRVSRRKYAATLGGDRRADRILGDGVTEAPALRFPAEIVGNRRGHPEELPRHGMP